MSYISTLAQDAQRLMETFSEQKFPPLTQDELMNARLTLGAGTLDRITADAYRTICSIILEHEKEPHG